jgi:hypothetical protein
LMWSLLELVRLTWPALTEPVPQSLRQALQQTDVAVPLLEGQRHQQEWWQLEVRQYQWWMVQCGRQQVLVVTSTSSTLTTQQPLG